MSETKYVQLGDLLTSEQIDHVVQMAQLCGHDDMRFTREMKTYLRTIEKELDAKGVLPDYMAYMLTAMLPVLRQVTPPNN